MLKSAVRPGRKFSRDAIIRLTAVAITALASFSGGLALARLLYEALFPAALWLGQPLPVLLLSLALAGLALWLWPWLASRGQPGGALLPFLPLFLNLTYLGQPAIDLTRSRFLFAASLWLTAVLFYRAVARRPRPVVYGCFLAGGLGLVYLLTLGQGVGRADTFEFQVVTPRLGIVHPTGYPLYLLLGRLFTLLPVGSVAWRLNLATAFYGVAAGLCLFLLGRRLTGYTWPSLLAAGAFALAPTFWSQAVEAEVYTLHALIVAAALLLVALLLEEAELREQADRQRRTPYLLAFLLGLGLTNHLTTVILLPGAAVALFAWFSKHNKQPSWPVLAKLVLAFLVPLTLYAYLPLRWAAVNGEPMGISRFVEWVIGGRFQGALQLSAWLNDPLRYQVVGRLLLDEWQPAGLLVVALVGLVYLFWRQRLMAVVLLLTWAGYVFYALSYYVPDLSVFLLPAHLILALWWAAGIVAVAHFLARDRANRPSWAALVGLVAATPLLLTAANTWQQTDRSVPDGRTRWGQAVLALPLEEGAAILADSEKFPPLFYLQQAEGLRPDLEIMVLPDEAAYRAELDERLAAGQAVYLARFLPGLAGQYHLRSVGPLVEASETALTKMPAGSYRSELTFDQIELLGYEVEPVAAVDPEATALTLYWQTATSLDTPLHVFLRWQQGAFESRPILAAGQHPANNSYPTVAWEPGEVVADSHLLPHPLLNDTEGVHIQAALAPPFTPPEEMVWQTVTTITVPPSTAVQKPQRARLGPVFLEGGAFPSQVRPGAELPVVLQGCGPVQELALSLEAAPLTIGSTRPAETVVQPAEECTATEQFVHIFSPGSAVSAGDYLLVVRRPGAAAQCGWLAALSSYCIIGQVEVSGVPLPPGATNFADQIALLDVDVPDPTLSPGGQLALSLTWQALAPLDKDYTVFVQVVDEQDQLVGQVDSWPLQGTLATSRWQPGETITDPYLVQLTQPLPPGSYRLLIGWYLLETGQRLPVLDEGGAVIEDRVVIPGLHVNQ